MTALPHLQSLTPGNWLFNFLLLCSSVSSFCPLPKIFKSICNKFKSCHYIQFCVLLLHFGIRAYLFSPDKGSCYVFLTRHNCCYFLASYGVFFQTFIKSFKNLVFNLNLVFHNLILQNLLDISAAKNFITARKFIFSNMTLPENYVLINTVWIKFWQTYQTQSCFFFF